MADSEDSNPLSTSKEKHEPKRLYTNEISSIFDLKSELIKKKSEVIKNNFDSEYRAGKKGVLAVKKDEKVIMKNEALERKRRIREHEIALRQEEEERLLKVSKKMQEKTELYDKLAQGNIVLTTSDNTPVEFMVNFDMKKEKNEVTEEQSCSTSDSDGLIEHFVAGDEQRVYGVSHMKFSTNEEKRQEEMQSLLDMSKKTEENRAKQKTINDIREQARKEKMARLRQRLGLPEPKETPHSTEPTYLDIPLPEDKPQKIERKNYPEREWDRGKGRYNLWIERQRNERDDEFKPPDSYFK